MERLAPLLRKDCARSGCPNPGTRWNRPPCPARATYRKCNDRSGCPSMLALYNYTELIINSSFFLNFYEIGWESSVVC